MVEGYKEDNQLQKIKDICVKGECNGSLFIKKHQVDCWVLIVTCWKMLIVGNSQLSYTQQWCLCVYWYMIWIQKYTQQFYEIFNKKGVNFNQDQSFFIVVLVSLILVKYWQSEKLSFCQHNSIIIINKVTHCLDRLKTRNISKFGLFRWSFKGRRHQKASWLLHFHCCTEELYPSSYKSQLN